MNIKKPDYSNSILNVTNSILKYYGAGYHHNTLPEVDALLENDYKHVMLMVMDGMGTSIIEKILPEDSFLRKHLKKKITSVFPPTTVAATTTLQSGLAPCEHGWVGWTIYYPELGENVDVFPNTKSDGSQAAEYRVAQKYQPYEAIETRIMETEEVKGYSISPFGTYHIDTFEELLAGVEDLCGRDEKNYAYVYWTEPDHCMHEKGWDSDEARCWVERIDRELELLSRKLTDTLILLTADHGHMNSKNVSLTDYPSIMECIEHMPSIEPRALAFDVKKGMEEQFEREFQKYFGEDFLLYTKQEVVQSQLFGKGEAHERFERSVGDYLAVAVGERTIFNSEEERDFFVGMHAGMTEEEMIVPLIVI